MNRIARAALMTAFAAAMLLAGASTALAATPLVTASTPFARFSPDRDGYRDSLSITYRLRASARTSVRVYRDGALVRTLRAAATAGAGTRTLRWDGRTGAGVAAPVGAYRWVVTARRGTRTVTVRGSVTLERRTLPADRWVGFYVPGVPQSTAPLTGLEATSGVRAEVLNYFQNTVEGFTAGAAANAIAEGKVPLITLEFWDPAEGVDQPAYSLKAISGGAWDDYLHRYARDAKAFGSTVWLRPLHEMNGDWYPWAGTAAGNVPADFVPAWRHIHDVFVEEGALNVMFVWCPSSDSVPNTAANSFGTYWPGEAYVDYMALDGYNFGSSASWSTWRSFADTFGTAYARVAALSPKPMFIAETGSSTMGGDKSAWIAEMFRVIPERFPRLQGVVWFDVNKECDWRIESSAGALSSFRVGAAAF